MGEAAWTFECSNGFRLIADFPYLLSFFMKILKARRSRSDEEQKKLKVKQD